MDQEKESAAWLSLSKNVKVVYELQYTLSVFKFLLHLIIHFIKKFKVN
jgi:hypothetical protein